MKQLFGIKNNRTLIVVIMTTSARPNLTKRVLQLAAVSYVLIYDL